MNLPWEASFISCHKETPLNVVLKWNVLSVIAKTNIVILSFLLWTVEPPSPPINFSYIPFQLINLRETKDFIEAIKVLYIFFYELYTFSVLAQVFEMWHALIRNKVGIKGHLIAITRSRRVVLQGNKVINKTNDIPQTSQSKMNGLEPWCNEYNEPVSLVRWVFVKSRFHFRHFT